MDRAIKALFSDGTKEYRFPTEPKAGDTVRLRFRALKDSINEVFLCINGERKPMLSEREEGSFVYYGIEYTLGETAVSYYFEVNLTNGHCYYDRRGVAYEQCPFVKFTKK